MKEKEYELSELERLKKKYGNSYKYVVMVEHSDYEGDYYSEIAGIFNDLDVAINLRNKILKKFNIQNNNRVCSFVIAAPDGEFVNSKYLMFVTGYKILDSKYFKDACGI